MNDGADAELKKEMFAWHGSTMYAAQLLEHELVNIHILLRRLQEPSLSAEDIDAFDRHISQQTLGWLVRELQKYSEPAPQFAAKLGRYVKLRNDLAHDFFKRHASSLLRRSGVEAMTEELQSSYEELRNADSLASSVTALLAKKIGWSYEEIQAQAAAEVEQLRGAHSD
jgi:hypothetical protein